VRYISAESVTAVSTSYQTGQPAINRIVHGDGFVFAKGATCCGSQCMAWRGTAEAGYCGLAGKP
jgi:hypothetical protein